ncbi:hypothetical protein C4Q28_09330 [Pseudomonas sp. SWI6]|uniref:RHS repeat domain-containing protein n=1 Tax=Pseudomonas sp. SWI6 TaxID=2083051 RepID=UPI000CE5E432|nr:hypothetical protein C4Q28_09330 [Pseudomonas sp. SWI6]
MLVAKALGKVPIRLLCQPDWRGREYDIDQDSLWQHEVKSQPIDTIAWDQCDHPGTPMELTDHHGEVAWAGQYKAWGDVREVRSDWAKQVGMTNPIRFQGQYHDHETGLHYNRYRYYDPNIAKFISRDPIGLLGGTNLYQYAPNPLIWIDPLGLSSVTVGRWMGPSEYDQMTSAGRVVQSYTVQHMLYLQSVLKLLESRQSPELSILSSMCLRRLSLKLMRAGQKMWVPTH